MIKSVEKSDLSSIYDLCKDNILGVKISCQIKAYGLDRDFLSVWCYSSNGEISAVISKFYDSVTVIIKDNEASGEIAAFLDMLGYSSLCCSKETADALGFNEYTVKKAYVFAENKCEETLEDLTEEHYKSSYTLISNSIPDSFEKSENGYLSFLSDFTFRKRRGLARIKGTLIDGKVAACALTSAETESAAIISGVACDGTVRKKGLGKKTVLSLTGELVSEGKTVYVIALNESAEGFYEHIGFEYKDRISFIERK